MPLVGFQRKFSCSHFRENCRENHFRIFAKNCLQKLKTIPLLQDLGLTPQQISERLELTLDTVLNYLAQQQQ